MSFNYSLGVKFPLIKVEVICLKNKNLNLSRNSTFLGRNKVEFQSRNGICKLAMVNLASEVILLLKTLISRIFSILSRNLKKSQDYFFDLIDLTHPFPDKKNKRLFYI